MTTDTEIVRNQQARYAHLRDEGHLDFLAKYKQCEDFFLGKQWSDSDKAYLRSVGRPALTINKIMSTIANVTGNQIQLRTEPVFKPRSGLADEATANVLTKLFMHAADQNNYHWVKSQVFTDGLIGSRGFFDIRMCFEKNILGDIKITSRNPTDVLLDTDADSYDPKDWWDVISTRWLNIHQFEVIFGKEKAKHVRAAASSAAYGYDGDLLTIYRQRFGDRDYSDRRFGPETDDESLRDIRVIERQHKVLDRRKFFVDMRLGIQSPVPDDADDDLIAQKLSMDPDLAVIEKVTPRVRWTITAFDILLYDDWSLYEDFTIVPYFPYFRRGATMGFVENLIDSQELLNKVRSQELHVVNTTANSGWVVRKGSLSNMDIAELEQRGAETGLVVEVNEMGNLEKITPNQVPTGLDRIGYHAEEQIKTISGVSDYQTGFTREDVSAKAVRANQQMGAVNISAALDNLRLTEKIVTEHALKLFQQFYTDERVFRVIEDRVAGDMGEYTVNELQYDGSVVHDLSVGEYDVIIASQPERDTFEESQFEQAVQLKELGIQVDDEVLVQASQLHEKRKMIEGMRRAKQDPVAQEMKQLELEAARNEVALGRAEAMSKTTEAQHNQAKMTRDLATARERNNAMMTDDEIKIAELNLKKADLDLRARELALKEQDAEFDREIKARESAARILQMKSTSNAAEAQAEKTEKETKLMTAGGNSAGSSSQSGRNDARKAQ